LLPNLSLPKNFFQITLNKDHPSTEGWHNVCICFIWLVVHQYKNIKIKRKKKKKEMIWLYRKKNKSLKNENKRSKYRKKKVNKKKLNKFWMKHYSKILVETILTSLVWAFTIIYFHTTSLGHNTSLINST